MRSILYFLVAVFVPIATHAETKPKVSKEIGCELALGPSIPGAKIQFAGFVKMPEAHEVFVRIEKPRRWNVRGWHLLVHGLLDSHRGYDRIARELLDQGYGVVRMDLRGFARTLHNEATKHEASGQIYLPSVYMDYREHVRDLMHILNFAKDEFGIERPRLVGHSMGGGLIIALLTQPGVADLVDSRAVVMAPYVYRLEYYLAEKIVYGGFPLPNPLMAIERAVPMMVRMIMNYAMDQLVSEPQMRLVFGEFFTNMILDRDIIITPEELAKVKARHVDMAIATVKGLRELNTIVALDDVPAQIAVDLVYGREDQLLDRGLARKLGRAVTKRGGRVFELNAGHMMLEDFYGDLAKIILETP